MRVRPYGDTSKRCSNRRIIGKELVSHHLKLFIATNLEIWSSNSNDSAVSDVGESFNDQPCTSHLSQPVIISSFCPVFMILVVGDGENAYFMTNNEDHEYWTKGTYDQPCTSHLS